MCEGPPIANLTDDETALLEIETDEGVQYYRARVLDRTVTSFGYVEGPSAVDQTLTVRTDAETVRAVWEAEDPVARALEALRADRIIVEH